MTAPADGFEALVSGIEYPMYVVTVADGERRAGCLVGFGTQCSMKPPRFLVCLSKRNHTFQVSATASILAVHFLTRQEMSVAELFGGTSGFDADKFARCSWRPGPHGVPLLDDCPNRFVGEILDRIDLGDHMGLLLRPGSAASAKPCDRQLGFQSVRDMIPGREA